MTVGSENSFISSSHPLDVHNFTVPATLAEHFVTCSSENKPLVLHQLLSTMAGKSVLIFASSLEHTHRL